MGVLRLGFWLLMEVRREKERKEGKKKKKEVRRKGPIGLLFF